MMGNILRNFTKGNVHMVSDSKCYTGYATQFSSQPYFVQCVDASFSLM